MKALKLIAHLAMVIFLTVISQLGGIAWLAARLVPKYRFPAFLGLYVLLSVSAVFVAPVTGRVPLKCASDGTDPASSPFFCALNRQYVTRELKAVLVDVSVDLDARHPGTKVRVLDAGFPFLDGFPLLPHLSHDDGRKADIALFYQDETGRYLPGATRTPIGYFAFEQGPTTCEKRLLSLRWDLDVLQPLWPDWSLEEARTRSALGLLSADTRVDRVFIEPHLKDRLGVSSSNIPFQGCRAARHDDHIHLQVKSRP